MAPEGMVHALEIIHSLLKPGGVLVDIHPTGDPPRIEVLVGDQPHLAGFLQETDDFIEYTQASQALEQAVHRGWFSFQTSQEFIFKTYAPTPGELFQFLSAEWKDALLLPEVIEQAEALYKSADAESKIQLIERVRIARYGRLG